MGNTYYTTKAGGVVHRPDGRVYCTYYSCAGTIMAGGVLLLTDGRVYGSCAGTQAGGVVLLADGSVDDSCAGTVLWQEMGTLT